MRLSIAFITVSIFSTNPVVRGFSPSIRGANTDNTAHIWALSSSIDETVERDVVSLRTWADQVGIFRDHVNLFETSSEDACWGVTVSEAAEAATTVLKVPSSIILSSKGVEEELDSELVKPAISFLENSKFRSQIPQFFLFLKVLLEYERKDKSLWHTWMKSLPRKFDTSVCMDEVELECLPPFAWSLANVERLHLDVFRQALPKLSESFLPSRVWRDEELTRWAFNVVFTRCWRYPDEKVGDERCDIVPLGDMFNHGDMNILLDYDEDDNCVIQLADDVEAGTTLHLSYGRPSNSYRFLVMFGFVDESQPEIMCQVKASDPSQKHVDMGYDFDKMVFRTSDGAISNQVWDVILFSILVQIPDVQERFYQAHMKKDSKIKAAFHEKFHLESCLTLRKQVEGTLEEMSGLLEKIDQQDVEKHPRLGMIRKNNVFVQQTFSKVKHRLDEMIQTETARRTALQEAS